MAIPEVYQVGYSGCGHATVGEFPPGTKVRIVGYLDCGGLCPKCSEAKKEGREYRATPTLLSNPDDLKDRPAFTTHAHRRRTRD